MVYYYPERLKSHGLLLSSLLLSRERLKGHGLLLSSERLRGHGLLATQRGAEGSVYYYPDRLKGHGLPLSSLL